MLFAGETIVTDGRNILGGLSASHEIPNNPPDYQIRQESFSSRHW